jgi:hypothetical protein
MFHLHCILISGGYYIIPQHQEKIILGPPLIGKSEDAQRCHISIQPTYILLHRAMHDVWSMTEHIYDAYTI